MFTTPILVGTGPVGAVAVGVADPAGVAAPCPKAAVPNAMLRPIATILNFAMLMDYVLLGFRARLLVASQNATAFLVLWFRPAVGLPLRRSALQECSPVWLLGLPRLMPRCTPQSMAW